MLAVPRSPMTCQVSWIVACAAAGFGFLGFGYGLFAAIRPAPDPVVLVLDQLGKRHVASAVEVGEGFRPITRSAKP